MYDAKSLGLELYGLTADEALVRCPFHSDSHPSASFNVRSGKFFCFSCGTGADLEGVRARTGGQVVWTDNQDVGRRLADPTVWNWVLGCRVATGNQYLRDRGLSDADIRWADLRETRIGVAAVLTDFKGRPVGCQIRKYEGFPKYLTLGTKPKVWPAHRLVGYKDLWVTEGVFGAVRGYQCGYQAVAVLGAKSARNAVEVLRGRKPKAFFDDDLPGYQGAGELLVGAGAQVVVPGDEADRVDWNAYGVRNLLSSSLSELAQASGSKNEFLAKLRWPRARAKRQERNL